MGAWRNSTYLVVRNGVEVTIKNMIVGEVPFDRAVMYQYAVGFAYLIIGLFVYFRRGSAPEGAALLHLLPGLVRLFSASTTPAS